MKKLIILSIALAVVSGVALGKCTNNATGKSHVKDLARTPETGSKPKPKIVCLVKRSDAKDDSRVSPFNANGMCKNCGCNIAFHDNLDK